MHWGRAAILLATSAFAADGQSRGARIFSGTEPLTGRLEGHAETMPASATACANCHAGAQPAGPALSAGTLLRPVARRGGPATVYTLDSFCLALRTGIDPAFVVIRRAMPRFELDDEQCASLWEFLTAAGRKP